MNITTASPVNKTCPLCGAVASPLFHSASRTSEIQCAACGEFAITSTAILAMTDDPTIADLRWCLSAATRSAFETGQRITLRTDDLRKHINSWIGTPLGTKRSKLLHLFRTKSVFYGNVVQFSCDTDWPLIVAQNREECANLLNHLLEQGLLKKDMGSGALRLTFQGWDATEPVAGGVPGRAFIAMSFDESLGPAFEFGIRPAIENDCGMTASRTDKQHFGETICDRIYAEIKSAQFVMADFTRQSYGVYFEAGPRPSPYLVRRLMQFHHLEPGLRQHNPRRQPIRPRSNYRRRPLHLLIICGWKMGL
jgi:hypothetical protein